MLCLVLRVGVGVDCVGGLFALTPCIVVFAVSSCDMTFLFVIRLELVVASFDWFCCDCFGVDFGAGCFDCLCCRVCRVGFSIGALTFRFVMSYNWSWLLVDCRFDVSCCARWRDCVCGLSYCLVCLRCRCVFS